MRDIEANPYTPDEKRGLIEAAMTLDEAAEIVANLMPVGGPGRVAQALTLYVRAVEANAARIVREPITMSDIRLAAGEGKLAAADVLAAANAVLRSRGGM